jgi:hypothetical protein
LFLCDCGSVHSKALGLGELLQNGALFVSAHSEEFIRKSGSQQKKANLEIHPAEAAVWRREGVAWN